MPEPEPFFGGWRIPKAAGQAESELVKAYLENFIQKKYNKRVQLDRILLANRQSQEKGGLHLSFYQGHYWLYPVKQPAPSPLEEVVAGQPFFFRGNCYLLSEEKREESPLAEISFPGKLSAGSLPNGQRLLLKDGRRTKSKKLLRRLEFRWPCGATASAFLLAKKQFMLQAATSRQLKKEKGRCICTK